jgi:drug/metabolite transporter (DMT)-like permease
VTADASLHGVFMTRDHIDKAGVFSILALTLLWGLNYTAIKVSNTGLSPVFMCFLRSAIASGCGIIYCLFIRQPLFHKDIRLIHGTVVGVLFGIVNGLLRILTKLMDEYPRHFGKTIRTNG